MRSYRGKTKDGKWVEGYYVFCRHHHYILPIHNDSIGFDERWIQKGADDEGWFEVIPETVGQSTGLKDENGNGKEIYEGDIVTCTSNQPKVVEYHIVHHQCGFNIGNGYHKIIGDIHTTPLEKDNG